MFTFGLCWPIAPPVMVLCEQFIIVLCEKFIVSHYGAVCAAYQLPFVPCSHVSAR